MPSPESADSSLPPPQSLHSILFLLLPPVLSEQLNHKLQMVKLLAFGIVWEHVVLAKM